MASPPKTTPSPASTLDTPPVIEPLHGNHAILLKKPDPAEVGTGPMGLHAKGFYLKKMAATQSFVSPSDLMVSPCTQKLAASKQRHYAKGKPLSLSSSFQASKLGAKVPSTLKSPPSSRPSPIFAENSAPSAPPKNPAPAVESTTADDSMEL